MSGDSLEREGLEPICDEFDRAWQTKNETPRIEDYLSRVSHRLQPVLFRELLKIECEYRCGQGDMPTREEFAVRFAKFKPIVDEVFDRYVDDAAAQSHELENTVIGSEIAHPSVLELPEKLTDYELLEEAGRGGMGVLFKALQRGTDRNVAVKMVRSDWFKTMPSQDRQRAIGQFYNEIKAAALLKHPNIVQVYHMGEMADRPYFVMEYVDGESLSDRIQREEPLSNRRAAEVMSTVADAVHHAHEHRILHRDIKPQNILIDRNTDQPKVADFGLAMLPTDVGTGATNSADGDGAGTISYMAPELFDTSHRSTVATEVYALGATLYEVLTGSPPFRAETRQKTIHRICFDEPLAPSSVTPEVSKKLDGICLRCLEKEPARRYASAAEFRSELQAYLDSPKHSVHMSSMGLWFFIVAFVILAINIGVFLLLPNRDGEISWSRELAIWPLIFSMYPPVFFLLAFIPARSERDNREARAQLWAMWSGKMFAAICISIGLRLFHPSVHAAILLSYPMFAGLSGMVLFAMAPQYWSGFYAFAIGFWVLGLIMLASGDFAPLEYGIGSFAGITAYGFYVRRISREYA